MTDIDNNRNMDNSTTSYDEIECSICCNNTNIIDIRWSACPTLYGDDDGSNGVCNNCLHSYLQTEINSSRIHIDGSIRCMCSDKNCKSNFQFDFIKETLKNEQELLTKYHYFLKNVQVLNDSNQIWCPNLMCSSIATRVSRYRAYCSICQLNFCIKCRSSHSRIINCSRVEENSFRQWKKSTRQGCKRCPSCRSYIEKDGGCRHMTCTFCHHEFCWRCGMDYASCYGGKRCYMLGTWKHRAWGESTLTRGLRKSLCAPIAFAGVGAMIGLGCAAVGTGLAAATIAVPVLTAARFVNLRHRRDYQDDNSLELVYQISELSASRVREHNRNMRSHSLESNISMRSYDMYSISYSDHTTSTAAFHERVLDNLETASLP